MEARLGAERRANGNRQDRIEEKIDAGQAKLQAKMETMGADMAGVRDTQREIAVGHAPTQPAMPLHILTGIMGHGLGADWPVADGLGSCSRLVTSPPTLPEHSVLSSYLLCLSHVE